MAKQDVIDYVMNTPGNTNKMVLEGMLRDADGVKLPEISEEDEGKVLTVIDGKWDKGIANAGGSFVIALDHIEDAGTEAQNAIMDKTYREVKEALLRGDYVTLANTPIGATSVDTTQIVHCEDGDDNTPWTISNNKGLYLYACSEDGYLQTAECGDK